MTLRASLAAAALAVATVAQAQAGAPDLVPTAVSFQPVAAQGGTSTVTITVVNAGTAATTRAFDVSVALTRDGGVCTQLEYCDESDDDWFVGTAPVAAGLAAGGQVVMAVQAAIPADLPVIGWNLFAVVDGPVLHGVGRVFESNEGNNTLLGGVLQVVAPPAGDPDLLATAIVFPPVLAQGATAPVTMTIKNVGGSAARPFAVSVALTRDGGVCTQLAYCDESDDDWFAGTATVAAGLAAGAEVTVTFLMAIPADLEPTTWTVFAVVDGPVLHGVGKVFESNEGNNTLLGGPLLVTVP